ncbi:MAG: hypothetical protein E7458_03915 [Ruminococcaceae bacterium]|nr:hypothetical protein [Oscillospiraceae bacterium]
MTVSDLLAYIEEVEDHTFSDEVMCRWAAECEAGVWCGVMLQRPEDFAGYHWPEDAGRTLLLPPPYSGLYEAYLLAKIALCHHESAQYENAMALYNRLYSQTVIWYAATYDPAHGGRMPLPEENA